MYRRTTRSETLRTVTDLESLGSLIGVQTRNMTHAYNFRDDLQIRMRIGKRTVYKSLSSLNKVQQALAPHLEDLMSRAPNQDVALAYRKGVHVADILRECTGSAVLVKTDICKFYDNISNAKIVETLRAFGMCEDGAKKVARLCCVPRRGHSRKTDEDVEYSTLQQGSAASCQMANLVGNYMFDRPIMKWLADNCMVGYKLYRYSDNIVLFLEQEPKNGDFIGAYISQMKALAGQHGFRTHSWSATRNNSARRRQEFLGIILNEVANIARDKRDWIKAVLFNAVVHDTDEEAKMFLEKVGALDRDMSLEAIRQRFKMCVRGYVSYAKSINEKFGNRMNKLCKVVELKMACNKRFRKGVKTVNGYRRDDETVEQYVESVKDLFV